MVKSKHGLNQLVALIPTPDTAFLHPYQVFYQVMDQKSLSKDIGMVEQKW